MIDSRCRTPTLRETPSLRALVFLVSVNKPAGSGGSPPFQEGEKSLNNPLEIFDSFFGVWGVHIHGSSQGF